MKPAAERERERDRERQRERDRDRDRERERQRQRQRDRERDRDRETERERDRERQRVQWSPIIIIGAHKILNFTAPSKLHCTDCSLQDCTVNPGPFSETPPPPDPNGGPWEYMYWSLRHCVQFDCSLHLLRLLLLLFRFRWWRW